MLPAYWIAIDAVLLIVAAVVASLLIIELMPQDKPS